MPFFAKKTLYEQTFYTDVLWHRTHNLQNSLSFWLYHKVQRCRVTDILPDFNPCIIEPRPL